MSAPCTGSKTQHAVSVFVGIETDRRKVIRIELNQEAELDEHAACSTYLPQANQDCQTDDLVRSA